MAKAGFKHKSVYLTLVLLTVSLCRAQMVRSDALQQDSAKLNLCIDRARHGPIGDQDLVPFEIDSGYLARARKDNPDVTFLRFQALFMNAKWPGTGSTALDWRTARTGSGM